MSIRTYSELIRMSTYEERLNYLRLGGVVGSDTFGFDRYLNQNFYTSSFWRDEIRPKIILRDNATDMGLDGYDIPDHIIIHHMNPIKVEDIINPSEFLSNPEYLVCVSRMTHNAIHYGTKAAERPIFAERSAYDTCPWRK